jgi:ribosomal protein L11 methyltransferase
MNYIQIQFDQTTVAQNEILIALLDNIGFDGFEEDNQTLKACIAEEHFNENLFNSIIDINIFKYSKSIIKKQNWNALWEADFKPIAILHPITSKPFVYLKAGFHSNNDGYEFNIDVTPKMSFGTGHHATTYLMVQQMAHINFEDKQVIDFGTGTGVLAILAEKLGAKNVLAIDCDEWSIINTKENIETNNCSIILVEQAETIPAGNKADVILANINLNIISENISAIKQSCNENVTLLFSGIMAHNETEIKSVIENAGFKIKSMVQKDGWLCLLTVS